MRIRSGKHRKILFGCVLGGLGMFSSGCSTPYMVDRRRDAADIFTLSYGAGLGAKAKVGPFQAGLLAQMDAGGLRGGEFEARFIPREGAGDMSVMDVHLGLIWESFAPGESQTRIARRKEHGPAVGALVFAVPEEGGFRNHLHYYTQIELVVGVIPSLRAGFNPGELLDFLLGWTTLDLYSDDLEWRKRKEEALPDRTSLSAGTD